MKSPKFSTVVSALAIAAIAILHDLGSAKPVDAASIELVGLTNNNTLVSFNANNSMLTRNVGITGLQAGEMLLGIDFRPSNGDLFGVTDANRIVTINPKTGKATLVSNNPTPFLLSGNAFGVDFNPNPDRIRVVSDARQNLRLNPNTGGLAGVDGTLTYADRADIPDIVAEAYTNSLPPSPDPTRRTTLYGIDRTLDILVTQGTANFLAGDLPPAVSPNTGQLFTVGSLGVDFGDGGFDIFSTRQGTTLINTAFAASGSTLYTINLSTGAATTLGTIGNGSANIIGLSARSVPEPGTAVSLLGMGVLALLGRCRRVKLPR